MLSVGRVVCRSGLPLGFADPGQEMIFYTKGTHLKRKARACMKKGVNISGENLFKNRSQASMSEYNQLPINLQLNV